MNQSNDLRESAQGRAAGFPTQQGEFNSPIPLQVSIEPIGFKLAKEIIETNHYSHRLKPPSLALGFYYKEQLATVICYGQPAGKSVVRHIFGNGLDDNVWELSRLFSFDWAPKNIESKCIGMSFKYIEEYFPNIKALVSFADENHKHVGGIYQATNWIYLGTSKASYMWVDGGGRTYNNRYVGDYKKAYHKRYIDDYKKLMGIKGRSAEDIAKDIGLYKVRDTKAKHRYVYLLGSHKQKKELRKRIILEECPYPKLEEKDKK